MKQRNKFNIINIVLIISLCIIAIGMVFLILLVDLGAENFALAESSPNQIITDEAKTNVVKRLMSEYNYSEQEATLLVEKTEQEFLYNEQYNAYADVSSRSIDWEESLKATACALFYIGGRHYASYDHIYIDKSISDNNYYYVAPNKNSLTTLQYNDMNIEFFNGNLSEPTWDSPGEVSAIKNFVPSNRNALSEQEPSFNISILNDFDTFYFDNDDPQSFYVSAKSTNMTNDSWNKGVYYRGTNQIIPNSNKTIGKGAAFYRFHYYDSKGQDIINTSNWTAITNLFATESTVKLFDVQVSCDIEVTIVYETNKNNSYQNLREDFYIKCRKESTPGRVKIVEANSNIKHEEYKDISISNGFMILPDPFYKYSISFNDGISVPMSFDDCLSNTFMQNGTYKISFLDVIHDSGNTPIWGAKYITVDTLRPSVRLTTLDLSSYDLYSDNLACFKQDTYNINWDVSEDIPITVELDGNAITNNTPLSTAGQHTIKVSKHYTNSTKTEIYDINIGTFEPSHNYELLSNGNSYTNLVNRYCTNYYGVRLVENGITNTYGYDTQQKALDKALAYETANYVIANTDGTFTYRGVIYPNNTALTATMSNYAQMNLFKNRDLSLNENEFLEKSLKRDRLYLNGFQFTYNSNPIFSSEVRITKALNVTDLLTATVKSILRDVTNPSTYIVTYNKTMDEQLTESGKYFIMDKNIFGEEYFFEAYYASANETFATIEYYNASGMLQTSTLSKTDTSIISGSSVNIKSIVNAIDPYATIKVRNILTNASRILIVGENYLITEAGTYSLTFIDRNNKQFSVLITLTEPSYVLSGVTNGGTANNNVKISLKNGYVVQTFIINGVSKGDVFQYNTVTGRYEYTVLQTSATQEVVLIFTTGEQTVNLAFSVMQ